MDVKIGLQKGRIHDFFNVLFGNALKQMIWFISLYFICSMLIRNTCNGNTFSYLYFALPLMAVCFVGMGIMMIRSPHFAGGTHREILPVVGIEVLIVLIGLFAMPNIKNPMGGVVYYGVSFFLVCLLPCFGIYRTVNKFLKQEKLPVIPLFHLLGAITLLLFSMNQQHMLYDREQAVSNLMAGSISICAGTIVLSGVLFLLQKKQQKKD